MPFINTRLNRPLAKEQETRLKELFGQAIATFPGKSEDWLMLNFSDNCRLWFRGENDDPMAYVEVSLLGAADRESCTRMTELICDILQKELSLSPDRVYVKYEFATAWGWNRVNF